MKRRPARSAVSWVGSCILAGLLVMLAGCGDSPQSSDQGGSRIAAPGEETYRRYCFSCHASGAAGAPRVGDDRAWRNRLAQGRDVLLEHTIQGLPGMPERGMCRACSDAELADAIDYMLEHSLDEGSAAAQTP